MTEEQVLKIVNIIMSSRNKPKVNVDKNLITLKINDSLNVNENLK
jgi:hypothetical protein